MSETVKATTIAAAVEKSTALDLAMLGLTHVR